MNRRAIASAACVPGHRDGYALISVLWICAAATALALSASLASRRAVKTSRNRVNLSRAEWFAEGCLARARSVIAAALAEEAADIAVRKSSAWLRVDQILDTRAADPTGAGCSISARAAGSRLDVNAADEVTLSRLFRYAGTTPAGADSIAAAIADWKDPDDSPRPLGAERRWYEAAGMVPPSNGRFTHIQQLAMVRGISGAFPFDSLLDVEEGGISINNAPAAVLIHLPGFTPEAASRVLSLRAQGRFIATFAELREGVSPSAREVLERAEPRLVARASLIPKSWILTVRASTGVPAVAATIEVKVEKPGSRVLIVRRRSWAR